MSEESEVIAYLERRRAKRNTIAAIVVVVAGAIGAIGWAVYAAGADERAHERSVDEYICAMSGDC
jgi:predicted negative regulator of RcsB-dependent stress response